MLEINKIYNMDCLAGMDLMIEQGIKVDAIITDPPYGTTACKWDSVIPFDEMWERLKLLRKERTPIVLFGSEPFSSALRMSNIKEYKYDWIWNKVISGGGLLANKQPLRQHENIIIFYKKQPTYNKQMTKPINKNFYNTVGKKSNFGDLYSKTKSKKSSEKKKNPVSIININKFEKECNSAFRLHPTQKPVALLEYLIRTYTNEGDTVLDFAAGSATTAAACQNTNRNYIGFELDENYYNIACKRIKENTNN